MKSHTRWLIISLTVLSVLALSAMWVGPVLADEGAPPPAEATETAPPAEETAPTKEAPPVDESTELLQQLPAGTDLIVLDEGGDAISLATEEASGIIDTADPMWCPAGVTPYGVGCSAWYSTLYELVTNFIPTSNGVIWIEQGNDLSATPVTIDGTGYWSDAAGYSLTIQGGWIGGATTTVNIANPTALHVPLDIQDWDGNVTITDLVVTGVIGTGTIALNIDTDGTLAFRRSAVEGNDGTGAELEGAGGVSVLDSRFNANATGTGLSVETMAAVSLTNIDAIHNGGHGANIQNANGTLGVTLAGTNVFSENGDDGLVVHTDGPILASNLIANANDGYGAWLDNCQAYLDPNTCTTSAVKPVTLTGHNEFKSNLGGLAVFTNGNITLSNVTAADSTGDLGVWLSNMQSPAAASVTLTGASIIDDNYGGGLIIHSLGAVTLNNISSNGNGYAGGYGGIWSYGLYVDNSNGVAKPVQLLGANSVSHNYYTGLHVESAGAVTISQLSADWSATGRGAYIRNSWAGTPMAVTLLGYGSARDNGDSGLEVFSNGAITATNLNADNNGGYGAFLSNEGASTAAPVTVNNTPTWWPSFNDNGLAGLYIASRGAVVVKDLDAIGNLLDGLYVDNADGLGNVSVGTSRPNWSNGFWENGLTGLSIITRGAVTLSTLWVDSNSSDGAYIDNMGAPAPKPVSVAGTDSEFSGNDGCGLCIWSKGAITTNNISAYNNTATGVLLNNDTTGAVGNVTVANTPDSSSAFQANGEAGLVIYSRGNIIVKDMDAWENHGAGAYLDNTGGSGTVTLGTSRAHWMNGFWDNYASGLVVLSDGKVTLSSILGDHNGYAGGDVPISGYGTFVNNSTAATPQPVILLLSSSFTDNASVGLLVASRGAITTSNITANDNHQQGVSFENGLNPALPQNVIMLGSNTFQGNANIGLDVSSYGVITLNNVLAEWNGGDGLELTNGTSGLAKAVILKGYVNVYENAGYGLYLTSMGAVTVTNLEAWGNDNGAVIQNNLGTFISPVTMTGGLWTSHNDNMGLLVLSNGPITFNLTDGYASSNGSFGWQLDNSGSSAVVGVTLNVAATDNIDFDSNAGYGLLVKTKGNIVASNLDAYNNGHTPPFEVGNWGVWLNNDFDGATGTVILNTPDTNTLNDNAGGGLYITSRRAITTTNLRANNNGGAGTLLDNHYSGSGSPQSVTLNGSGRFNRNGNTGFLVSSYGAITVSNIEANDNGQNYGSTGWGAYLDNCQPDGGCTAVVPLAVTLLGSHTFNANWQDGLAIDSLGPILAGNVTAYGNGSAGARLYNASGISNQGITFTGVNVFNDNSWGLVAYSNGAITLSNVTANWNTYTGAWLENMSLTLTPSPVALSGTNFFLGNSDGDGYTHDEDGLVILTDGNITISNLTANWNDGDGAYLETAYWDEAMLAVPNLTMTGISTFGGNWGDGLEFHIVGNVVLTRIKADNNGGEGMVGGAAGNMTITCGSMTGNDGHGWALGTYGSATLIGVFAFGNGASNTYEMMGDFTYVRSCPLPW